MAMLIGANGSTYSTEVKGDPAKRRPEPAGRAVAAPALKQRGRLARLIRLGW